MAPLSRTRRAVTLGGLAATLLPLPGCQSISGSTPSSLVRIIDASPDAGGADGLDVYQGSTALAYSLALGLVTSYVPITPGTYSITVDQGKTQQVLARQSGTFGLGRQYTVLIGNYLAGLQETILEDQSSAAPSGQVALRFIDQSTRAGTVDLYLIPTGSTIAQVQPVQTGLSFGSNSGYINVPAATYSLVALPTGTVPTVAGTTSYSGAAIAYPNGSARTFILFDQKLVTTPGLQVNIARDYDSPSQ